MLKSWSQKIKFEKQPFASIGSKHSRRDDDEKDNLCPKQFLALPSRRRRRQLWTHFSSKLAPKCQILPSDEQLSSMQYIPNVPKCQNTVLTFSVFWSRRPFDHSL